MLDKGVLVMVLTGFVNADRDLRCCFEAVKLETMC
jgi:hypothetical protein